jgi:hypothetical protein
MQLNDKASTARCTGSRGGTRPPRTWEGGQTKRVAERNAFLARQQPFHGVGARLRPFTTLQPCSYLLLLHEASRVVEMSPWHAAQATPRNPTDWPPAPRAPLAARSQKKTQKGRHATTHQPPPNPHAPPLTKTNQIRAQIHPRFFSLYKTRTCMHSIMHEPGRARRWGSWP